MVAEFLFTSAYYHNSDNPNPRYENFAEGFWFTAYFITGGVFFITEYERLQIQFGEKGVINSEEYEEYEEYETVRYNLERD